MFYSKAACGKQEEVKGSTNGVIELATYIAGFCVCVCVRERKMNQPVHTYSHNANSLYCLRSC